MTAERPATLEDITSEWMAAASQVEGLEAAWLRVCAATPAGWTFDVMRGWAGPNQTWHAQAGTVLHNGRAVNGFGVTPVAALTDLAAKLEKERIG